MELSLIPHEKLFVLQLLKKTPTATFMEAQVSPLCSQDPVTCPHPEPDEPSP